MKRTVIFLDPKDYEALFRLAFEDSLKAGHRIGVSELIRQALTAYLKKRSAR